MQGVVGQILLIGDRILVSAENGDIALVEATPESHRELGRIPAVQGKTWNHPVRVEDVLLVRNAEEMAAFRLPNA